MHVEISISSNSFVQPFHSAPQANHSQYSSPVEALTLIVESKSLLVRVNNSTFELHFPSLRRVKSLQSYCSVEFNFLAANNNCVAGECKGEGAGKEEENSARKN